MRIPSTPVPPCGWNSYDSYGIYLTEAEALANLEAFVAKLKPHGYEYFCIDACWYAEGDFLVDKTKRFMCIDEFGRFVESPKMFPSGLKFLADKCHDHGVKFGIHIMRGLPAKAVELNTPILGHPTARAQDIHDPQAGCCWCQYTAGIDMDKPGAQEYYDSVVERLAAIGVDFIKADNILEFPRDFEAVAKAIDKVSRPILLSLSPGNEPNERIWPRIAAAANLVRITGDIWDLEAHVPLAFDRWAAWEHLGGPACWLDLDMLPFGAIQVHVPEDTDPARYPVLGCRRQSSLSRKGKLVMMTQRAMACSPLIFGGAVHLSNDADLALATDPEMLACNRNGDVGKRILWERHVDVRRCVSRRDTSHGWLGLFNRQSLMPLQLVLTPAELGFTGGFPETLYSIWDRQTLTPRAGGLELGIEGSGVVFIRY
jgi:hypothetical protein